MNTTYYELFNKSFQNAVPAFTFNYKGDGRNGLGFRNIDELTDDYVTVSNSISTLRLYFDCLKSDNIILNEVEYTVVYHPEYPNRRFIPVERYEDRKHLVELLKSEKSDELLMMFYEL